MNAQEQAKAKAKAKAKILIRGKVKTNTKNKVSVDTTSRLIEAQHAAEGGIWVEVGNLIESRKGRAWFSHSAAEAEERPSA